MHQSPSTSNKPMSMYSSPHRSTGPIGLTRYGSAPGSLLTSIADSVISGADGGFSTVGSENLMSRFFSGDSPCLTSESSCKATASPDLDPYRNKGGGGGGGGGSVIGTGLQRSYGLSEISEGDLTGGSCLKSGSPLIRHSSSPAGFFSNLMVDNGFSVTRGIGNYSGAGTDGVHVMASRRLKSQLSFSRQDSLSQISEISIPDIGEGVAGGNSTDENSVNVGQSYISSNYPIGSWDDTNSIVFSAPPSKRAKDNNGDIITGLSNIDSQFSLPQTSLEMATVEKLLQIQQDSIPCKIRAKRGCATHPRSIAERERRTRISEKLRKLQDLVPNMDKQTNTADMLDLAVHHIKGLQSQVQDCLVLEDGWWKRKRESIFSKIQMIETEPSDGSSPVVACLAILSRHEFPNLSTPSPSSTIHIPPNGALGNQED